MIQAIPRIANIFVRGLTKTRMMPKTGAAKVAYGSGRYIRDAGEALVNPSMVAGAALNIAPMAMMMNAQQAQPAQPELQPMGPGMGNDMSYLPPDQQMMLQAQMARQQQMYEQYY